MPESLKEAIVKNNKHLYVYDIKGHIISYAPKINNNYDSKEYDICVLGFKDVLEYIDFDSSKNDESKFNNPIDELLTVTDKEAIFGMFGFSNFFWDFFCYSFFPVHIRFAFISYFIRYKEKIFRILYIKLY